MRLSTSERRELASWLEIARSHYERRSPFQTTLHFAQAPDCGVRAQTEGADVNMRIHTELVTCRLVSFGGSWVQWVACDPRTEEPIVFGEVYQSRRASDDAHAEFVRQLGRPV